MDINVATSHKVVKTMPSEKVWHYQTAKGGLKKGVCVGVGVGGVFSVVDLSCEYPQH